MCLLTINSQEKYKTSLWWQEFKNMHILLKNVLWVFKSLFLRHNVDEKKLWRILGVLLHGD